VRWQSVVDFVVLVVVIDLLLRWSARARALRLVLGILGLRIAALLARQLNLLITAWMLDAATIVALLVLLIVFQPELRRALMRFDPRSLASPDEAAPAYAAVAAAADALARARCGALIVLVRRDAIAELVTGGVALDAAVSAELLQALFQKGSPVHDGAASIAGGRIMRAGAVLPLTHRVDVPEPYGTRHRAGLGLMERSDALVIVVSEERGEITVMCEGQVERVDDASGLREALARFDVPRTLPQVRRWPLRAGVRWRVSAAAAALAALVWGVTFLLPGRDVRERTVPVEFVNVPPGLVVASQSADAIEVWLRGSEFVFTSIDLTTLIVRCDLATAHQGVNRVVVGPSALDLPLGLEIAGLSPRQLTIRLTSS
jgi:diadenylate cyclase